MLNVNYKNKKEMIGNNLYECARGEAIKSLRSWAKEFNCTPRTVKQFFSLLESDGMIETKSIGISTHLKVCNYDTYQGDVNSKDTERATDNTTDSKQELPTSKERKKVKKERIIKKFIPPSLEEVITYFDENDYTKEAAEKAYNYYSVGNWNDGNGKPVNSWKQKMVGNWFKEEYRKASKVAVSFNSGSER